MPLYPFANVETAEYREILFSMSKAPSIGAVIKDGGEQMRRLPSNNRVGQADADRTFGAKFPYASDALPRWTRPVGTDMKFDSKGRPVIRNKAHEADIASRMDMEVGGVEQWGE